MFSTGFLWLEGGNRGRHTAPRDYSTPCAYASKRFFFHGSGFQPIFRRVGKSHLAADYKRSGEVRTLVKKLFVLPLLPARLMKPAFDKIRADAEEAGDDDVMSLLSYVNDTWFCHPVWRPVDFVRTKEWCAQTTTRKDTTVA